MNTWIPQVRFRFSNKLSFAMASRLFALTGLALALTRGTSGYDNSRNDNVRDSAEPNELGGVTFTVVH